MSIKAEIMRDSMGNIIVQMKGDINYDNTIPLRSELTELIDHYPEAQIQIDMAGMEFIGSSGINHFVETLQIIKKQCRQKITLSNVDPDFVRVFKLYGLEEASLIMNSFDMDSDETRSLNIHFGNRKRTFEN